MKQLTRRRLHLAFWGLGAVAITSACSSNDSESSSTADASASGGSTSAAQSAATTGMNTTGAAQGPGTTGSSGSDTSQSDATTTAGTTASDGSSGVETSTGGSGGTTGTSGGTTGAGGDAGSMSTEGGTNTSTTGGSDPVPSEGCTVASPPSGGTYTIDVDGTEREYILNLPEDYDPTRPYPLILAWHGAMYSAEWVDTGGEPQTGPYFGIEEEANGNAIFVAPQALTGSWTNQDGRDLAFADAMVARFEAELCLDESRLFSVGFSMGAIMTMRIGCARADKFRAIAPLSGSWPEECPADGPPIAYFSAHGDVDTTITPEKGMAARDEFVSRNGCSSETVDLERERCVSFEGCDAGYPVNWCLFSGAHTPAPFAGVEIWAFLSQF
jgi:poly(3-hydroxybutyrate) depolymerase